jgi:chromosome segregation ATPase
LRFFVYSLILSFFLILLGRTGSKVRSLAARVDFLKSQSATFEKHLESAIAENASHINKLQDYQSVLYVAQGSNTALSKHLLKQEHKVEKLQINLASVLKESYLTKEKWNQEKYTLQDEKKELKAEFQALSQALSSQSNKLAKIGEEYGLLRVKYEESQRDSSQLLKVNQLKEVALEDLQMRINKLQMDNRFLSARLDFTEKESTFFSVQDKEAAAHLSGLRGIYDGNGLINDQVDKKESVGGIDR